MRAIRNDLEDTINAPLRPIPGALPVLDGFKNLRKRHLTLVEHLAKMTERRELAIAKLIRADEKVRDARKAVARSSKRLEQARDNATKPNTMQDDAI